MRLFGKEIRVRKTACGENGAPGGPLAPMVRLYAKVTDACNARCPFCSNGGPAGAIDFDLGKFLEVVRAILGSGAALQRVCLTGGEPSCAEGTALGILQAMEADDLLDVPVFLSTNGISPAARRLMRHPRLDRVTMSLHHWDRGRLAELYGLEGPVPDFGDLGVERRKLTATCTLVRGYVDSADEARRMMDFALRIGCSRLGFVSLMPKNAFCREAFVDVDDLRLDEVEHLIPVSRHASPSGCKCRNFLYASGDRTLSVYARGATNPDDSDSILLFDGRCLRQGFGRENAIY